jgi:hypothetical protein
MPGNSKPPIVKPKGFDLYFDESRQRIGGQWFIVAGVAVEDSDKFRQRCESIESTSRKGKTKWGKANKNNRLAYLRAVISDGRFREILLFSYVFRDTRNYVGATIRGIDLAVANLHPSDSAVSVYVDGLVKTQYREYQVRLRKLGCHVEKVRGTKDENEPLIRLADAVAGATRDLIEDRDNELKELFSLAVKRGILVGWISPISGPRPTTVYM